MEIILRVVITLACAALSRLGGSVNKNYRRIGIGAALVLYGALLGNWWALLSIGTSQLFRLPITLRGDSIPAHWYNWLWLPIIGFLYGLVPLPLAFYSVPWWSGFAFAGIFGLVFAGIVALSNIKTTAQIFKWQYVELVYGALIGLGAAILGRKRGKG